MSVTASLSSPLDKSRVVLLGPPGAGKRTQAAILARRYRLPAISTGDLFRAGMAQDTPLGARLRDAIGYGEYVDDATTNAAIERRLAAPDCLEGFVLHGCPRTLDQLLHLDDLLEQESAHLDAVVCLDVDTDELVRRLSARARELGRLGDRDETIGPRLALYQQRTAALVDVYDQRGLVVRVDATDSVDAVGARIASILTDFRPAASAVVGRG